MKQGPMIVGKGKVTGPYQFDRKFRIIDPENIPWTHQVPVKWKDNFIPVKASLGDQQRFTVRKLLQDGDDFPVLEAKARAIVQKEAVEGRIYQREVAFRHRNRALIQAKKTNSDYRCEVCGFSFEETYGSIGHGYIVAHHVRPLANRRGASCTSLEDIALLCANCHAMVHANAQNKPLEISRLRKLMR